MEKEANQLYRQPQITGQARDEDEEEEDEEKESIWRHASWVAIETLSYRDEVCERTVIVN